MYIASPKLSELSPIGSLSALMLAHTKIHAHTHHLLCHHVLKLITMSTYARGVQSSAGLYETTVQTQRTTSEGASFQILRIKNNIPHYQNWPTACVWRRQYHFTRDAHVHTCHLAAVVDTSACFPLVVMDR